MSGRPLAALWTRSRSAEAVVSTLVAVAAEELPGRGIL